MSNDTRLNCEVANEVFSIKPGVWQARVNGKIVPAEWPDRGTALAGMQTEERRQARPSRQGAIVNVAVTESATTTIVFAEQRIELADGEIYAGIILGNGADRIHHVVLLPGDKEEVTFAEAREFAVSIGGELPTRREQSLLYANLKDQFQGLRYYWSSEQLADCAWFQVFRTGSQHWQQKDRPARARAVRRLPVQKTLDTAAHAVDAHPLVSNSSG